MFLAHDKGLFTGYRNTSKGGDRETRMLGDEVVDSFGRSRLPNRAVFYIHELDRPWGR